MSEPVVLPIAQVNQQRFVVGDHKVNSDKYGFYGSITRKYCTQIYRCQDSGEDGDGPRVVLILGASAGTCVIPAVGINVMNYPRQLNYPAARPGWLIGRRTAGAVMLRM